MKFIYLLVIFSFLSACSSVPTSEIQTQCAVNDLKAITEAISRVEHSLSENCKNGVENQFKTIYSQIESVKGQVDNISNSCRTEKAVLDEKITTRNVFIALLGIIIFFLIVLIAKRKI